MQDKMERGGAWVSVRACALDPEGSQILFPALPVKRMIWKISAWDFLTGGCGKAWVIPRTTGRLNSVETGRLAKMCKFYMIKWPSIKTYLTARNNFKNYNKTVITFLKNHHRNICISLCFFLFCFREMELFKTCWDCRGCLLWCSEYPFRSRCHLHTVEWRAFSSRPRLPFSSYRKFSCSNEPSGCVVYSIFIFHKELLFQETLNCSERPRLLFLT